LAERVEAVDVTFNQSLFLGARPTLELRFVGPGFGERRENFNSKERGRWVELSCSTRLAGRVIVQSLLKILRGTDVNNSGSKSKEETTHVPFDAGLWPLLRAIRRASAINAFISFMYAGRRP